MKLNLGCGKEPLKGFENLDKLTGWLWESGLSFPDESIEAITVSHTLMYVAEKDIPFCFSEMARVLKVNGVLRITEDATDDPLSERYGGHPEHVYLTSESKTCNFLRTYGFFPIHLFSSYETIWHDNSLLQNFHGGRPKCFFVEGIKK